MPLLRTAALSVIAIGPVALMAACTSATPGNPSTPPSPVTSSATSSAPSTPPPVTTSAARPTHPTRKPVRTHAAPKPPSHRPTTSPPPITVPGNGPVIVIDPGHSPSITHVDPATGLPDSDYENEPEMRDVFAVAELVRAQLRADGYRVVMTKNNVDDRVSLGQRAAVANRVHAALALSIHDQAGSNGGIGFQDGNNTVYYQSVGGYRETPNGTRITFTDKAVAAASDRCGHIFQTQRSGVEGHSIRLMGDVGYDLGSRGLPPGDMWMVQLLSKAPWIYNEAGGNSAGMSGLNWTDQHKYARGIVAGVEHCVPSH